MLTWWVIGIVVVIYAGYAIYFYFFVKKKNANKLNKPAPVQPLASAKDFHNELNIVADLAVKNIEEKITHLEHLIESAHKKSEQLEHVIEGTEEKSGQLKHLLEYAQEKSEQLEQSLEQSLESAIEGVQEKSAQLERLTQDAREKSERLERLTLDARKKSEQLESLIEDVRRKSEQFDVKIKFASNIISEIKNLAEKQHFSLSAEKQQLNFLTEKQDIEKIFPSENPETQNPEIQIQDDILDILTNFNSDSLNYEANENDKNEETANSDKHRIVLQMSREGYSVMDIARITGLGKGEVMLLRQLYNEKQDIRE